MAGGAQPGAQGAPLRFLASAPRVAAWPDFRAALASTSVCWLRMCFQACHDWYGRGPGVPNLTSSVVAGNRLDL